MAAWVFPIQISLFSETQTNSNPKPEFMENFQTQNPYPNPSLIFFKT
jgi:hypothetical protein